MDSIQDSLTVASGSKKRKRTGKERAAKKALAIEAEKNTQVILANPSSSPNEEEAVTHGPKELEVVSAEATVDLERVATRIPTALKHLRPTFKQARTFEVRRLVKKVKFLRTKPDTPSTIKDLEAQLALLTHLTLDPIIQSHLLLKLHKHHSLRQLTLPTSITDLLHSDPSDLGSSSDGLRNKVENRICSSKIVSESVKSTVAWVVGDENARLISKSKSSQQGPVGHTGRNVSSVQENTSLDHPVGEMDEDEEQMEINPEVIVRDEEETEEENDIEEDMIDDGWESGSISVASEDYSTSKIPVIPSIPKNRKEETQKNSLETNTTQSGKLVEGKLKQSTSSKTKETIKSSTFLPSLATGFISGDSSDPDLDSDIDDSGLVGKRGKVERKNRRGQRARQAIWEKKYGKGAKHVVRAREEEQAVEAVKIARRQEREQRRNPTTTSWGGAERTTTHNTSISRGREEGNANLTPMGVAVRGEKEKSLHPSWEAAKLRRQKEVMAAPKATKIVFD
ncbi:hypothetical protein M231_04279 [Tremella mesenterica]|uniref:Bud22 domain-containing protein n=1 Tax=Tremella mesenterica TaxID=5217 RepID=A0A4Q1BL59_TREME|nr:hypothetical protein M231_04279 [Tremella mesenterica]